MLYIRVTCHSCHRADAIMLDETDVPAILRIGCKECHLWVAMNKPKVIGLIHHKDVPPGVSPPKMRIAMTKTS